MVARAAALRERLPLPATQRATPSAAVLPWRRRCRLRTLLSVASQRLPRVAVSAGYVMLGFRHE
eukprot:11679822-Alexandrium_andersonii.AAC.1